MSLEPSASDVSARSLDLNSAAVAHQEEPESSVESRKFFDVGPGEELEGGLRPGDQNVREAEENEIIGDDTHLVAKSVFFSEESLKENEEAPRSTAPIVDCDDELEINTAMPEMEEVGIIDSKHPSGDTSLIREDNFANDANCFLKKEDVLEEAGETPMSNPVGVIQALGCYPDDDQFQSNEYQKSISGFSFGDMVWGKVRSHPWWPGQIYPPSCSSEMALKHRKTDCFLVAYFGDNSFAWNDASQLKPFESCFSQMEKQSNLNVFVDAVDDSLREVARCTEIGMTCACIADELITDLKHQVFENAGIKEGTCFHTLDPFVAASAFEPGRLLDYIHDLAQFPCEKFEKLELVKVTAQLKAIYRSKGYPELPEFCSVGGIFDNEEVISTPEKDAGTNDTEYKKEEIILDGISSKEKKRGRGRPSVKKKHVEGKKQKSLPELMEETVDDSSLNGKKAECVTRPVKKKQIGEDGRKEKSLPELMRQTADYASLNGEKVEGELLAASKTLSKKRMASGPGSIDHGRSKKKRLNSLGDLENVDSLAHTRAVKIGQRISQVANKMEFSHNYQKLRKDKTKEKGRTVHGRSKAPTIDAALVQDYPAPGVMLSQLCLAAQGSSKAFRFEPALVGFFVSWRDSQVSESLGDEKPLNVMGSRSGLRRLSEFDLVPVETKSGFIQDTYWSDVIFEESPKKENSSKVRKRKRKRKSKANQAKKKKSAGRSLFSGASEPTLNISEPISDCSAIVKDKQQGVANFTDNESVEECNPAALILNFSDANALPSESSLITIFSQYGPLKEGDTEVLRKSRRASVVFKRGADAEVAFSSAGKFNAFGPALVSYRLRYSTLPSPDITPMKDPPAANGGASVILDTEEAPTDG